MKNLEGMKEGSLNTCPQFDCFICYRRNSGYFPAKMVHSLLSQKGISCFLDLEETSAGFFNKRVEEAIRSSRYFILMLTKGSLENCLDEQDWVRKEVEMAQKYDKVIIPVRVEGFEWPRQLEGTMPASIQELETLDSVVLTTDYFDAAVSRLISFMNTSRRINDMDILPGDATVDYLYNSIEDVEKIQSYDMMFHTGERWMRSNAKLAFLAFLLENHIPVRVLINSPKAASSIIHLTSSCFLQSKTRQKLFHHLSVSEIVQEWAKLSAQFPGLIQVRVSDCLFFHRSCILRFKNGNGNLIVKNYRYGDQAPEMQSFSNPQLALRRFKDEFDFVWEKLSYPIEECNLKE